MNQYVTGGVIRQAREKCGLTQAQLAAKLCVSDKAVSKWETGKGYPDITLLESLAQALGVSTIELLSGEAVTNGNRSFNVARAKLYVCPVCGNVIFAGGAAVISCCGLTLPPLEAEVPDEAHALTIEQVEDEYYVTAPHEMTKQHFISFLAAVTDSGLQLVKLYPEGNAEARFTVRRTRMLYWYCNRHGLFRQRIK